MRRSISASLGRPWSSAAEAALRAATSARVSARSFSSRWMRSSTEPMAGAGVGVGVGA